MILQVDDTNDPADDNVPEIYSLRLPKGTKERAADAAKRESRRTGYRIKTGTLMRRAILEYLDREEARGA